ncbi:hypothetical protein HDV06_001963 [Boothiomyces sp. JEL0866]|nr:hypothetical protein HDV06_001963 [Boothiomyces sp. JEL0866]
MRQSSVLSFFKRRRTESPNQSTHSLNSGSSSISSPVSHQPDSPELNLDFGISDEYDSSESEEEVIPEDLFNNENLDSLDCDDNIYTDDDEDGRNSNSTPKPLRWYDLNANMTDYLKSVQVSIINAQTEVNAKISFNGGLNRFWIDPPNPNIKIWNGYQSGKAPDPKHYYRRRVYVWAPHLILPALVLSCPKCGNRGKVDAKSFTTSGWGDRPRIVYGLGDYYFLIFQIKFLTWLNLEFPAVLTHRAAIDKDLLKFLFSSIENSFGISAVRKQLLELSAERHHELELKYLSLLQTLKVHYDSLTDAEKSSHFEFTLAKLKELPKFSTFTDKEQYMGKVPSEKYLTTIFQDEVEKKMKYYELEMQRRTTTVLRVDHSYKVLSSLFQVGNHIMQNNGVKLVEGKFTALNEFSEIRLSLCVQSSSLGELECAVNAFRETQELYNTNVKYVYTDNCCSDRAFYEKCLPTITRNMYPFSLLPLPQMNLIIHCSTHETILSSLYNLNNLIKNENEIVIGLDTEWTVIDGIEPKPEVVQIALSHPFPIIYVIHIANLQTFPDILKQILESPKVIKVGQSIISADVKHLKMWKCSIPRNTCVKIEKLAKQVLGLPGNLSLKAYCEKILFRTLEKDDLRRKSNWKTPLSQIQIAYAARDAWASILIYNKLMAIKSEKEKDPNYVYQDTMEDNFTDYSPSLTSDEISPPLLSNVDESPSPPIDPGDIKSAVLLDVFHAMKRITDTVSVKHPFNFKFCRALSESFFFMNESDVNTVTTVLKEKFGMEFEDKYLADPRWILARVRRKIYPKELLKTNIQNLLREYSKSKYKVGRYGEILSAETKKQFKNLLAHVEKGCIRDPEDLKVYYKKGTDANSLTLYRCIRGTNEVELFHQYLEMHFQSWNSGWPVAKGLTVTNESFGIAPILPKEQHETINEQAIAKYSPSMKYLARRTKTNVPYLRVATKKERRLFLTSQSYYIKGSKVDFKAMAEDWNAGTLKCLEGRNLSEFKPLGHNDIWKKLDTHLQTYQTFYLRSLEKKVLLSGIHSTNHLTEADISNYEFGVAEPVPILGYDYEIHEANILSTAQNLVLSARDFNIQDTIQEVTSVTTGTDSQRDTLENIVGILENDNNFNIDDVNNEDFQLDSIGTSNIDGIIVEPVVTIAPEPITPVERVESEPLPTFESVLTSLSQIDSNTTAVKRKRKCRTCKRENCRGGSYCKVKKLSQQLNLKHNPPRLAAKPSSGR